MNEMSDIMWECKTNGACTQQYNAMPLYVIYNFKRLTLIPD